jgi:VanZ family protein
MTALRRGGVAAAVAAVIALAGPIHYADLGLPFPDTVAHAMLAYALTVLALAAFPRSRSADLVRCALGLAIASEMAQALVGREMSLHDVVADAAGVAAAYAPVAIGRLRELTRTHPHLTFAELRRIDPRRARPSRAVLVLETIAEA